MTAFPKPAEDLEKDRDDAEALAAGVYLGAPELSMLWELERARWVNRPGTEGEG